MTPLQRSTPLLGLIVGQICLHSSTAGMRLALPVQALSHGTPQWLVGPLIALFSLAPIALAIPAGRLADRRGYHTPARLATALTSGGAVCAVLATLAPALLYPLACAGALLSGAGANIGLTTIQRAAGRGARDATELKRVFSWLGIAPSVSHVLGPGGTGLLIDRAGYQVAFCALAALPLLCLWAGRLVPHESPAQPSTAARPPAWDLLATPMLRRLLIVNWFMSTSWDVHAFLVPVLGHQRGFSASAIGSVLGVFALAVTAVRLVLPVLAHRLSEAQVLRGAMGLVAAAFALYPFAHSAWAMGVCAACLGLALGSSHPMIMTTLHRITPSDRHGEAIALRSIAINCSAVVMPLSFGVAGTLLGASGLFWFMAAAVGAGSTLARDLNPAALSDEPDRAAA